MKPASPIPFEQFMEQALHDPEHGYYARKISGIGRRGDFTTAPMLSAAPARAIAAWVARAMKETGCRDLIEIGPGEGILASGVLQNLPWWTRFRTRLHLVETSAPLMAKQKALLGNRVVHHAAVADALAACGGKAVIYSNELVDAFAVRRFKKTSEGWLEIAVHFDASGRPQESLMPPSPLPESTSFSPGHAEGQCVEIHESYRRYLADWMPLWKAGRLLTIDYGAEADVLYHRRPRGTVRGYLFQQLIEGLAVYENPGRQDITADVNFTDLMKWPDQSCKTLSLRSFGRFLREYDRTDVASDLSDPAGAGGAFLVLEQEP